VQAGVRLAHGHGLLQRFLGDVEPLELQRDVAAVDLDEREARGDLGRALVEVEGRLEIAARVADLREVHEGLEVVPVQREDAFEPRRRLGGAAGRLVREREVEHGGRGVGIELDGAPPGGDGALRVLLAEEDGGERELNAGVVGVLARQLDETLARLFELAGIPQPLGAKQLVQ
jgi:hypothetical protein